MSSSTSPILTFGYGNRSLEQCLILLRRYGIGFVVDVRSSPWSRFKPDFSRPALAASLQQEGLHYVFMGEELGGRPDDPDCYDEDGRVDYLACRQRPKFMHGIERLRAASGSGYRVAVMCSECRPESCHRTKLVAQVLREHGVEVQHIDERDELCSHDEVVDRLRAGQLDLLGGEYEDLMHKSRGRYARLVHN
jgi:uncharacterized protein (DUF488 family)